MTVSSLTAGGSGRPVPSGERRNTAWGALVRSVGNRERFVTYLLGALLLFAVVGVMLTTLGKEKGIASTTPQGDALRQSVYAGLFVTLVVVSRCLKYPRQFLVLPGPITLLLAWCALSALWAIDPGTSIRRLILTTMIMWMLFRAVRTAGYEASLTMARRVLAFVLVANYVAIVLIPHIAIHEADMAAGELSLAGDWRGILPQKNFTGPVCAITALAFVFDARRIKLVIRAAMAVGATFFLFKTHSKTSLALLALVILIGWGYMRYNPRYRALLVAALLAVAAIGLLLLDANWDDLAARLSRPDALTGRGQIWPVLLTFWRAHWVLGSGFGSFWGIGYESPVYQYASARSWVTQIGNGHNGYLDLLVAIGLPGLVLAVVATMLWPIAILLTNRSIPRKSGAFLLSAILFCAGANMTETSLLDRDSVVQVLFTFILAMLFALVRPQRAPQPAAAPRAPAVAARRA